MAKMLRFVIKVYLICILTIRMSGIFGTSLKIYFADYCCHVDLVQRLLNISKMPFYAVAKGRTRGIYHTWADCEAQVKGFSGAKYKKFGDARSANEFIKLNSNHSNSRAYSSSSTNNYDSSSNNLKRSYASSSSSNSNKIIQQNKYESDSSSSEDDLTYRLSKQLNDVQKRANAFSKGIEKIMKRAPKVPRIEPRQSILIQPPQQNKFCSKSEFEEDNEGYVQVYTDGACTNNGKSCAQAGLGVYWGHNHPLNLSQSVTGRATNNCGEIQAATMAIKIALQNGVNKLTINTDSQFLINSATKWMPGWKRRGWKLSSGASVKNETDFKDLDSVLNKVQLKWNYVKAHDGLYGNEMADRLAKEGAALYNK